KTDRVIIVPGPQSEVEIVDRIFTEFAARIKTRTEIANDLNAEGIYNAQGRPWQMQTIDGIFRNEKYLGQTFPAVDPTSFSTRLSTIHATCGYDAKMLSILSSPLSSSQKLRPFLRTSNADGDEPTRNCSSSSRGCGDARVIFLET